MLKVIRSWLILLFYNWSSILSLFLFIIIFWCLFYFSKDKLVHDVLTLIITVLGTLYIQSITKKYENLKAAEKAFYSIITDINIFLLAPLENGLEVLEERYKNGIVSIVVDVAQFSNNVDIFLKQMLELLKIFIQHPREFCFEKFKIMQRFKFIYNRFQVISLVVQNQANIMNDKTRFDETGRIFCEDDNNAQVRALKAIKEINKVNRPIIEKEINNLSCYAKRKFCFPMKQEKLYGDKIVEPFDKNK